ncbi:MAG: ABC transporter permease [Mycoplasma sp.]|nr:ABC transporter permease [Mycoplasma sp.]
MGKLSVNEHFFARMFVNRNNEFKNNMYFLIFIYGIALNALLSITIGMFISTFSKTSAQVGAYGLIIIIPSLFLSGQFLPVAYLAKYDSLYYPSLITPYRYITLIITSAFNGGEVMYGPTVFNFSLNPGAKIIRFRPPNLDMQWLYETINYRLSGSNGKVADYDDIKKEFAKIMKVIGAFDKKQEEWAKHNILEVIRNFINSSTKSSEINSLIEKLIKLNILDQETTQELINQINKGNLFGYLLKVLLNPKCTVQPIEWFVGLDCYQNWELLFCHFYPISLSVLLMILLFRKFEFSSR